MNRKKYFLQPHLHGLQLLLSTELELLFYKNRFSYFKFYIVCVMRLLPCSLCFMFLENKFSAYYNRTWILLPILEDNDQKHQAKDEQIMQLGAVFESFLLLILPALHLVMTTTQSSISLTTDAEKAHYCFRWQIGNEKKVKL